MSNPELGRFRSTATGHVFNHSKGIHGTGYALCLACGRAEPMQPSGELPHVFRNPHKKLRRAKDEESFCPADDWKIKQNISLGHELHTDIFELQLKNTDGIWLNDRIAARTIAVALRDSLAELIGVQASELGCEVKPGQPEEGGLCQSILIFDHFAAGYSSRAESFISDLFQGAFNKLNCPRNCDSACPHCVLDFDQRFAIDSLDRHVALQWLNTEWLHNFQLPEEYAYFGSSSFPEYRNISQAIRYSVSKNACTGVRFYTGLPVSSWDISISPLRMLAYALAGQNIEVEIILPESALAELDFIDRYILAGMAEHPNIGFASAVKPVNLGKGLLIAETLCGKVRSGWARADESALLFGQHWGKGDAEELLVKGDASLSSSVIFTKLDTEKLRPAFSESNDRVLQVHQELNGPVKGFGDRFWELVALNHPASKELLADREMSVKSVRYTDRYLKSPLTATLFMECIGGLRKIVGTDRWGQTSVSLVTLSISTPRWSSKNSQVIWDDWQDDQTREQVIKQGLGQDGIRVSVFNKKIRHIEHGRILTVEFTSGDKVVLALDQGLSYWQAIPIINFDFSAAPKRQTVELKELIKKNLKVKGADLHPTILAIRKMPW